jgi:hypothetical protein
MTGFLSKKLCSNIHSMSSENCTGMQARLAFAEKQAYTARCLVFVSLTNFFLKFLRSFLTEFIRFLPVTKQGSVYDIMN